MYDAICFEYFRYRTVVLELTDSLLTILIPFGITMHLCFGLIRIVFYSRRSCHFRMHNVNQRPNRQDAMAEG